MATRNATPVDLAPAAADYSAAANEGCFLKLAAGAAKCSVLGERADGILANTPIANAMAAAYTHPGNIARIRVGAVAVAAYAELTPNAAGLAITAVSTNIVTAKALEAGQPGEVIRALLVAAYAKP